MLDKAKVERKGYWRCRGFSGGNRDGGIRLRVGRLVWRSHYQIQRPLLDRPPAALVTAIDRYINTHAPEGSWHKAVTAGEPGASLADAAAVGPSLGITAPRSDRSPTE